MYSIGQKLWSTYLFVKNNEIHVFQIRIICKRNTFVSSFVRKH